VFGPRQIRTALTRPSFLVPDWDAFRSPTDYLRRRRSRDFTFVGNIVDGNLLAATPRALRAMITSQRRSMSLLDLLAALNSSLGSDVQPVIDRRRRGTCEREWLIYARPAVAGL